MPLSQQGLGGGATSLFRASRGGAGLYDFQDATFTNANKVGHQGPSLSEARNAMSGTSINNFKNNTTFFNVVNGIQYWMVPIDGTYRITATGAGMWNHRQGGYGARMRGDFYLTQGEVIRILVGQIGNTGGDAAGGSFVVKSPYNTNGSILVIAGGGGGGHNNGFQGNSNASTGNGGRQATNIRSGLGYGGSGGQGGTSADSGAGGGFFANGQDGGGSGSGGRAYVSGGYGGNEPGSDSGGFGGGGTSGNSHGGGGGGYSGGGGSGDYPWHGGGGGSYNNGSNQSNSEGAVSNNSTSVIIQLIG